MKIKFRKNEKMGKYKKIFYLVCNALLRFVMTCMDLFPDSSLFSSLVARVGR
jgi:hypothetical protein